MRAVAAAMRGGGEPPPAPAYDGRCVVRVGDAGEGDADRLNGARTDPFPRREDNGRPGAGGPTPAAPSFVIRLQDVVGPRGFDVGALVTRLSADGAGTDAACAALEA